MQRRAVEVPWEPLAVGNTRPATFKALGIPFWFLIPILFLPLIPVVVTHNPFWLVTILPLAWLGRYLVERDHNRPRRLFLSLISGAMFADRDPKRWGGHTADPHGTPGSRIGVLHDR